MSLDLLPDLFQTQKKLSSSPHTTRREKAQETEFGELLNPWYAWFDSRLNAAIDKQLGGIVFRRRGSNADRWLEVPAGPVIDGGYDAVRPYVKRWAKDRGSPRPTSS